MRKLRYMFETVDVFALVPRVFFDEYNVAKTFKLLSRIGALIEEIWAIPNRSKDVQLFRLIHEPDKLAQVRRGKTRDLCLYGTFGRAFLNKNVDSCSDAEIGVRLAFLAALI
eukprot:6108949-Pyramimonas_sp.AAC.1